MRAATRRSEHLVDVDTRFDLLSVPRHVAVRTPCAVLEWLAHLPIDRDGNLGIAKNGRVPTPDLGTNRRPAVAYELGNEAVVRIALGPPVVNLDYRPALPFLEHGIGAFPLRVDGKGVVLRVVDVVKVNDDANEIVGIRLRSHQGCPIAKLACGNVEAHAEEPERVVGVVARKSSLDCLLRFLVGHAGSVVCHSETSTAIADVAIARKLDSHRGVVDNDALKLRACEGVNAVVY